MADAFISLLHLSQDVNMRFCVMLTGEVITVETLNVPKIKGRPQPQATFWSESVDDDSPYVFGLRVFGCRSFQQPAKPTPHIGIIS